MQGRKRDFFYRSIMKNLFSFATFCTVMPHIAVCQIRDGRGAHIITRIDLKQIGGSKQKEEQDDSIE